MSVTRARMAFAMNAPALRGASAPVVPAWVPTDLGAALKAWWSADDHGTARMVDDGGGLISSWTDKVGGLALTATTTARPTWAATSFNSAYAGVTFDGVANALTSTTLTTLPTGSTPGEIWLVLSNTDTGATARTLLRYGAYAAAQDRSLQRVLVTSSRLRVLDTSSTITDTAAVFDGAHIVGGYWAGTTQGGRFDGADTNPATGAIVTLATGTGRIRLGAGGTLAVAGGFSQGAFSDAFITTALTLLQRQQLEGWAAWNKGLVANLPALHPYKSARP